MFRFVLLFSYIIPLSLRVNLDFAKSFYLWMISKDKFIAGTVVRCLTIPEELGRISYVFTDKTGTLTQNFMVLKRLSIGNSKYNHESFCKVTIYILKFSCCTKRKMCFFRILSQLDIKNPFTLFYFALFALFSAIRP